jgi:hypothetical protein
MIRSPALRLLTTVTVALGLGAFVAACAGIPDDDPGAGRSDFTQAETVPPTTLSFAADWSETASGPLVAGGRLALDYDAARLPRCRASHNGNPGWQITASVRFLPADTVVERGIMDYAQTATGPDYYSWVHTVPEVEIPAGTTAVEVWFMNGSGFDNPCTDWDSDFGRNYRFAVANPETVGTMGFTADWRNVLGGTVARGGTLLVSYAPARMEAIVADAKLNGVPYFASKYHCYGYGCCSFEYERALHVRFHEGDSFATYPMGDLPVALAVPADASRVEVYFDADVYTTTWYCGGAEGPKYRQPGPDRFYDSNFGANFVYTIP